MASETAITVGEITRKTDVMDLVLSLFYGACCYRPMWCWQQEDVASFAKNDRS
ncbi:MAG: hypothetical protein HWD60_16410 [Defluviicoccus sp.]|nr:MAG: hypothetical protein HWD60_16410 [Defluviicoccus sp.]